MKSFLNFVKENTGLQKSQGGFGSTSVEMTGERAKAEAILAARGEQMYHPGGKKDDPRGFHRTTNRADQEVMQAKLEDEKRKHSGVAAASPAPTPVAGGY